MKGCQILTTAREARGLTCEQVARGAGVALRTLKNTENGVFSPSIGTLVALINFLGLDNSNRLALLEVDAWMTHEAPD